MYNEDSYDETVNPAFDLYREFRAEDERKFREALGENESDNFDDQASEAGANSSGGAVIGTPESWCNMTGGKAVNMEFFGDETVSEPDDTENTMYSEPDYSEERETVEAKKPSRLPLVLKRGPKLRLMYPPPRILLIPRR